MTMMLMNIFAQTYSITVIIHLQLILRIDMHWI